MVSPGWLCFTDEAGICKRGSQVLSLFAGSEGMSERRSALQTHSCFRGEKHGQKRLLWIHYLSTLDVNGCLKQRILCFFYCVTFAKVTLRLFSYRPVVVIQFIDLLTRFSRWNISLHPLDSSQVSIWKLAPSTVLRFEWMNEKHITQLMCHQQCFHLPLLVWKHCSVQTKHAATMLKSLQRCMIFRLDNLRRARFSRLNAKIVCCWLSPTVNRG